ncbi:MAG: acetyl-CoA carboxylase carboxyltransferase subunit alpha [Kiritimatiellae bacterium]|nr:acetyl-CoA carboxylase carboxyltransferase subunit alpha [Kiritimatiellia bacterium]
MKKTDTKTKAKAPKKAEAKAAKAPVKVTAMDRVKLARDPKRPHLKDFIENIFDDFEELHGDRLVNDDRALVGGFGSLDGVNVLILGHNKGATVEENMEANFGMANPDGYRKAMRLARLAGKFHNPIITFVDTPGAYPGREAEERGQAEAIAKSLEVFALLKTPVIIVVTGEGGSGGALAIAVGDKVLMLENAVYSVISPEGCAGILWRDGTKAPEAAEALKITASDLEKLGIIDEIVKEPAGGAQKNIKAACEYVKKSLKVALKELAAIPVDELVEKRYAKLRKMGNFYE